MANKILIKSSQDDGSGATELFNSGGTAKLHLGELALNTSDGILFAGTEIGADGGGDSPGAAIGATTDVYAQPLVVHTKAQALGTDSDVTFGDARLDAINLGHASENTLTASGGVLSIENNALAQLASPTFTGTPAAPTASVNTSTTQIATTAFVMTELGDYAPLASPTLTGTPAAPTASAGTNSTQIATTAYVDAAADASALGLQVKDDCDTASHTYSEAATLATSAAVTDLVTGHEVEVGMTVTGTNIPPNTIVTAISTNGCTISNDAEATGSETLTFVSDLQMDDTGTNIGWTYAADGGANSLGSLTYSEQEASMSIDGVALTAGKVVLLRHQGSAAETNGDAVQNGIYYVSTAPAAGSAACVLSRIAAMDNTGLDFPNAFTFVKGGNENADTSWVCSVDTDFTKDTDDVTFSQFNGPGNVTAGTNISKTGNTLNVDDAFLKNDASDTTTGTITAAGFTTAGTVAAEHLSSTDDLAVAGLATVGETLGVTGVATFTAQSVHNGGMSTGALVLDDASITDTSGAISFGDDNLSTTGTLGAGATTVTSLDAGSGSITTTGTVTADVIKLEGGTHDTTLDPGTPTASVTYTLPAADGTANYVLKTNGSGALSWTENTGGLANDEAGTITLTDTATSAVSTVMTLKHSSTGVNAVGGGVGLDFVQDTAGSGADNFEIGMQLESVISDASSTSEDFDFSVKLMAAGLAAAEKFKVSSIGDVTFAGMLDGGAF